MVAGFAVALSPKAADAGPAFGAFRLLQHPGQDIGDAVSADPVVAVGLLSLSDDPQHERLESGDNALQLQPVIWTYERA